MHPIQIGDTILGKYEVTAFLGQGGMGLVLAARHLELGELVALKFLLPELRDKPEVAARFAREARTATRIKNEHVARVRDVDNVDGVPFIVMEHLTGCDLAETLREGGQFVVGSAADVLLQACEAIQEAHALGIVHRDLKPHNLFVTTAPDGAPFVKVLDFGISKSIGPDVSTTTTAVIVGTPQYMSPEQLLAPRQVDGRSDVWALGVILYEMLTGALPFTGDTFAAVCSAIFGCRYRRPSELRPDIPVDLEELLSDVLTFDPGARVPSIEAFAARLSAFATEAGRASYTRIARVASRSLPPPERSIAPAEVPVRTYRAGVATALGVLAAVTGLAFAAPHLRSTSAGPVAPTGIVVSTDTVLAPGSAIAPDEPRPVAASAVVSSAEPARIEPPSSPRPAVAATHVSAPAPAVVAAKSAGADPCASGASAECAAACEGGSAAACNGLGVAYAVGTGVARDTSRAVGLYARACDAGLAKACVNLGAMHFNGDGVYKNEPLGARYFSRGCEAGEAAGCLNLSVAYGEGRGVPKDPGQAFAYADRACKGGARQGCVRVELARMAGDGVPKDVATGLSHLDALCTRREPIACEDLARLYDHGVGADIPKDPVRAAAFSKKACDLGLQADCQTSQLRGNVESSETAMVRGNALFQSECDRGVAVGCAMLGKNLIAGIGVPVDRERGLALLRKACAGGFEDSCKTLADGRVE